MSASKPAVSPRLPTEGASAEGFLPRNTDLVALALVIGAFALMYVPTYLSLAESIWATDEQGHGPSILAVSLWLIFQKRHALGALDAPANRVIGWLCLFVGLLLFLLGRTQDVLALEVISKLVVFSALALLFTGWAGWKLVWFPVFFMIFMIPLPETLVAAVTAPLKSAVSAVASMVLYEAGYPVGRSGVILTVGPYQLLVADACAGLNSMFTLEALGMLYMNLMNYKSVKRNVTLALLLVPIAFVANIIRVLILVLVTYYFGDEAGQGFVHGFAGMVLFMVALALMLVVDKLLNLIFRAEPSR